MARAALPLLPLLPLLWLLSWVPPGAGTDTLSVQMLPQVLGLLGENATLPCQLQSLQPGTRVTQLTWEFQKQDQPLVSVAVFHPQEGLKVKESRDPNQPPRVKFLAATVGGDLTDASLTVSELRVEDEGTYVCHISTFPQGSAAGKTQLRVRVPPQNRVELQEVSPGLISGERVPVALCISERGRPPAQVSWALDDSNAMTSGKQEQQPGPLLGTVTVTSLLSMVPSSRTSGKNVTCRVEHESLEEPALLPVTLSVSYLPEVSISGYDDNWYIGRENMTLSCEVHSNPEPENVVWKTTTGTLPRSAEAQGRRLLIRTVDESINTTFICLVTNTIGTGQGELTIQLKGPPLGKQPDYTAAIATGAVIGVLVLGAVVIILFLCRRRLFDWCLSSSSANSANRADNANRANSKNRMYSANGTNRVRYSVVNGQCDTNRGPR